MKSKVRPGRPVTTTGPLASRRCCPGAGGRRTPWLGTALPNKKPRPGGQGMGFQQTTSCLSTRGWKWLAATRPPLSAKVCSARPWRVTWLPDRPASVRLQLRDSAGLCVGYTHHRFPPFGPEHPGYGAPRSSVFNWLQDYNTPQEECQTTDAGDGPQRPVPRGGKAHAAVLGQVPRPRTPPRTQPEHAVASTGSG
jgi:hypothetical protein